MKAPKKRIAAFAPIILVIGCGVLTIFILLVGGIFAVGMFALNSGDSGSESGDAGVRDSSCNGLFYPNVIDEAKYAKAINDFIPDKSPLEGLGTYFISGGRKTGINPSLLVAHARKESSFATCNNCVADKGGHNAFGRRASSSQPNIDGWYKWSSWQASLDSNEDDEPTYIKRQYISGEGLYRVETLEEYISKYAPSSDGNNPTGYAKEIKRWMQEIADDSEGGVECN